MLFAQISDPHVVAPPGKGELYGVDTADALIRALTAITQIRPHIETVVMTGDLVNKGRPDEYAGLAGVLSAFPFRYLLVPGNHDHRDTLRQAFPAFAELQGAGFIQYTAELGPVRLVVIDTLIEGRHDACLDETRLGWLDAELGRAPAMPTVIAMHHPPFKTGLASFDAMPFEGASAFEALIRRHPHVERIICGHNHRAVQRRFGGTIVSVCPSTAFAYALHLEPGQGFKTSAEPPGFQVHLWTDGQLVTHTHALPPTLTQPAH